MKQMEQIDIQNIIDSVIADPILGALFGVSVVYNSLFDDVDGVSLVISFPVSKGKYCGDLEGMTTQLIDKKDPSTNLQMKGYQDKVDKFFIGYGKNFGGFQTIYCLKDPDQNLRKNDKNRNVFTRRYRVHY